MSDNCPTWRVYTDAVSARFRHAESCPLCRVYMTDVCTRYAELSQQVTRATEEWLEHTEEDHHVGSRTASGAGALGR